MLLKLCSVSFGLVLISAFVNSSIPTPRPVRFYLFPDYRNTEFCQELIPGDSKSLLSSKYDKWKFPIILVHGMGQNYTTSFPSLTKDALLKQKIQGNVILVDWSSLDDSSTLLSDGHGRGVPLNADNIGRKVAGIVVFLINHGLLNDPTRVHIIGFSLGAQIAGLAGHHLKHYTGKPIQRITGLDPAGPLFSFRKIKGKRLDHTAAYFVDVIHTNQARYGYIGNCGHVDFFPNGGGPEQPGCTSRSDIPGFPGSCAHGRAWEYFTETILNMGKIWACKANSYKEYSLNRSTCKEKVLFGLRVPPSSRGSYFFDIRRDDPGFGSPGGYGSIRRTSSLLGSDEEVWTRPLPSLYN